MKTLYAKRTADCPELTVEWNAINIHTELELSRILGFGGAFTEATAVNYAHLTPADKKRFINTYFGRERGIGYNFCRLHIGSCDFGEESYSLSYKEDLSDFSIERDRRYVLSLVRDALAVEPDLFLFASPWSPPAFMKESPQLTGGGRLQERYYPLYAQYFVKFIKAYLAEGVKVQAVTVQNEPNAIQPWESCVFTAEEEITFAVRHLRPALDAAGLDDVKIIVWDHNKERLFERAAAAFATPEGRDAIWGAGFHWYSGEHFDAIRLTRQAFPDKMVLETELCHGDTHDNTDAQRAMAYAVEYCENLANGAHGICDWNMMLDSADGGPYHCRPTGGCYAPIYRDVTKNTLKKDAIFAPIGLFAKHIERGDVTLATTSFSRKVHACAVRKVSGAVVLFVVNEGAKCLINVRIDGRVARFEIPARSATANEIV